MLDKTVKSREKDIYYIITLKKRAKIRNMGKVEKGKGSNEACCEKDKR